MWVIFTHLKLGFAVARHNFKWVKIEIRWLGRKMNIDYVLLTVTHRQYHKGLKEMYGGLNCSAHSVICTWLTSGLCRIWIESIII